VRLNPGWFDALFILRPTLFFPAWTAFLVGFRQGQSPPTSPVMYLLWLAVVSGAAFLLNQLTDHREDSHNGKLLPLWDDLISTRMLRLELTLLSLLAIVGCFGVGLELSGLLALFFLIAGIFYNYRPFRLKTQPVLGVVACTIGGVILFLIGARAAGALYQPLFITVLPYIAAGAAATLLTHVPDLNGDRTSGARTFPVVYGLRITGLTAVILVAISACLALWLKDYILLAAAGVSLPFYLRFFLLRTDEAAQTAVKVSVFSLAVTVGTTWLPFLVIIALYYPFARWYHRQRLGIEYPTFRTERPALKNLPSIEINDVPQFPATSKTH
jgi:geranylgeranylglycerol-phosphate geranylgeranyltransferase